MRSLGGRASQRKEKKGHLIAGSDKSYSHYNIFIFTRGYVVTHGRIPRYTSLSTY